MRGYFNIPYQDDSTYTYPPLPVPTITATANGNSEIDLTAFLGSTVTNWTFEQGPSATGPWTVVAIQTSPIFANTGLAPSTTYFYRVKALLPSGYTTSYSSVQNATTGGASPAVKFHSGHYFWLNNSQWGSLATPGAEQTAFVNFVSANAANPNIQGVELYLRQKDIETTQGNYAIAKSNIDFIFNTVKAQPRKLRVILAFMDRDYGGTPSVSTSTWPQYMINNGWAIAGPSGNGTASILNFNNSTAVNAFVAAVNNVCDLYNSEPLLEMIMVGTETSDPFSGATAWTAATYLAALKSMYASIVTHCPNTLIRVPTNFLSFQADQDTQLVNLFTYLRGLKAGGFCGGGPDPEICVPYIIHAAALFRGASVNGISGSDLRGIMEYIPEVQGPYGYPTTAQMQFNAAVGNPVGSLTGTYTNGSITGPTQAGMSPANWLPTHAWHIMWRSDDTQIQAIPFINSNGPSTLPGTPSEGTWNTN